MRLPNNERCRVDREKITGYLLCAQHPDGFSKAAFFALFGFTADRWQQLAESLRIHGREGSVVRKSVSEHGRRYTVEGALSTPSGRTPTIHSVWIVEKDERVPRLITAYPA